MFNFPSACSAGSAVTYINTTPACSPFYTYGNPSGFYNITNYNSYNATYAGWAYNQTVPAINWVIANSLGFYNGTNIPNYALQSWVEGHSYYNATNIPSFALQSWVLANNFYNSTIGAGNITGTVNASTYCSNVLNSSYLLATNQTYGWAGNCTAGQFVMNVTYGGVQCLTPTGAGGNSSWNETRANSLYISLWNTSVVLTSNLSYVLTSNRSYVLTSNASYVQTPMIANLSTNNNWINVLAGGINASKIIIGSNATKSQNYNILCLTANKQIGYCTGNFRNMTTYINCTCTAIT